MSPSNRLVVAFAAVWGAGNVAFVVALLLAGLLETVETGGPVAVAGPTPRSVRVMTPQELSTMGLGVLLPVAMPADNPLSDAKVELGKLLFFDRRMSGNGVVSCATCHAPNKGWGDGNELSLGYPGTLHWRNSQTIINVGYLDKLFWAGESPSLEAQAKSAWTGNLAGNLDSSMAEERLRQIPEYVRRFKDVFGADAPSFDDALRAVAAFEATINSRSVPFDLYMKGDADALSEAAQRGMRLFTGRAGCIQCHGGLLFTNESFHNLDVPQNPAFETDPQRQIALRYQHRSRGVSESVYRTADRDLGLFYTTKQDEDRGKFRTPPLREVGQTGPYMHNGVFDTLLEVVEFYNGGGGDALDKDWRLSPLGLSQGELGDIVAFLESLTGDPIIVQPPSVPEYEILP